MLDSPLSLSACVSMHLSLCLSVSPLCLSVSLSLCLSLSLSLPPSISVSLSVSFPLSVSVCLPHTHTLQLNQEHACPHLCCAFRRWSCLRRSAVCSSRVRSSNEGTPSAVLGGGMPCTLTCWSSCCVALLKKLRVPACADMLKVLDVSRKRLLLTASDGRVATKPLAITAMRLSLL